MDKEEAIKEVMGLVYEYSKYERWYYEALQIDVGVRNAESQCNIVEDALKDKLRCVIDCTHTEGYISGYTEAQEYL